MAFDIYGCELLSGHCEVHPWVHQEYPCSQCYADSQQRETLEKRKKEFWAEQEAEYYKEMEEQLFLEGAYYGA